MNVKHRVEGSKLVIEVDLSAPLVPSKSGKSFIVGTTAGFEAVVGVPDCQFSLNVIHKK